MANFCSECGAAHGSSAGHSTRVPTPVPVKKKARKVSAYSKAYGKHYTALKKKHPRSSFGALSKKAHAATRKGMKK